MANLDQKLSDFFEVYPVYRYAEKEPIIEAQTEPEGAYFLVRGQVRQYIFSEEGEELTLHVFEPGSFFPMMWVMNHLPNRHYYEAMTEVEVRLTPASDFTDFLLHEPELAYHFAQRLLYGLDGLLMRVESLSLQHAQKRVVSILLYLVRHFGDRQGKEVHLRLNFTHREIATFTGLARETTSVEISKLEKQGLVEYRGSSLIIPDLHRLELLLK